MCAVCEALAAPGTRVVVMMQLVLLMTWYENKHYDVITQLSDSGLDLWGVCLALLARQIPQIDHKFTGLGC